MKIEDVNMLLDAAKQAVGSDYKVGKMSGISAQRISNWRHGETTMPVADVALIAHVAGLDASMWTLRAVVAKHEGTEKGDRLMKALGKTLLATGVAVASSGANAHQIFSTAANDFIRCIERLIKNRPPLHAV